jgi:hypothetical protein
VCLAEHLPDWSFFAIQWIHLRNVSKENTIDYHAVRTVITVFLNCVIGVLAIQPKAKVGSGQEASGNLGVRGYNKPLAIEGARIPSFAFVIAVLAELVVRREIVDSNLDRH